MKKLFLFSVLSVVVMTASAKSLFLNTGGLWGADNATFAIWYWGNTTEGKWSAMMTEVSDNLYTAEIDDDNNNVIFVRMKSGTTEPSWDNKWNQTGNLTIDSYDTFTITGWGGETSEGIWSNSQTGDVGYTNQAPSNCPDIILQAFYYDSYSASGLGKNFGNTRWETLIPQVQTLAKSFDIIWLPPSAKSTGGTGYIPTQLCNQSSDWGSAEQLNTLITSIHDAGAKVMADIVVNHLGNSGSWCTFNAEDFGEFGTFQPDASWVTANDEMNYNDAAGSCKGKGTVWDDGYGDGQNYGEARDLAHDKHEVREMCRAYMKWLKEVIGYDAWRWDFGKGFHGSHENDYNKASGAYFSVIEYWDSEEAITNKLNDASWNSYAFDFPTKYRINTGIGDGNYSDLLCPGLICSHPNHSVTFVDNHDTFRREYNGSLGDTGEFMGTDGSVGNYANRTVQAYAFILSMPGVPCVFYPHYYTFKDQITALCDARHRAGVHSGSSVSDEAGDGYYKATITGTNGGSIKLRIGPNSNYGHNPDGYTAAYVGENCGVYYVQRSDYQQGQGEDPQEQTTVTVGFMPPTSWSEVAAYSWNSIGTLLGDWPGTLQTADADGWIRVEIPSGAQIIFNNNGNGEQTVDSQTLTADICFGLGEKDGEGKFYLVESNGCIASSLSDFYLVGYIDNNDLYDALEKYRFDSEGELKVSFSEPAYVYLRNNKTNSFYMSETYLDENSTSGVFHKSVYGEGLYEEKMFAPADKALTYHIQDNGDDTFTLSYTMSEITTAIETLTDTENERVEIYTPLGQRVNGKYLPAGVYLIKSTGKVRKIIIQ